MFMFKIASINHRFAAIGQSEVGEQLRAALVEGEEDEASAGIWKSPKEKTYVGLRKHEATSINAPLVEAITKYK